MKGKITIEADESKIHCEGSMLYEDEIEEYEVVRALTQAMGINTPDSWARLVAYCLMRLDDKAHCERTKIVIPAKKENEDGRND